MSGPKASAESLTPRRSSLAEADTVAFQSDPSGPGAEPDVSLSSVTGWSPLRFFPVSRCLILFLNLENGSRTSSMSVLCQRRWWFGISDRCFMAFPAPALCTARRAFLRVTLHFLLTLFRPLVSWLSLQCSHHAFCVEPYPSPLSQTRSIDIASTLARLFDTLLKCI